MPPREMPASGPSLSTADIYYILFRHKWKIAVLSSLGILAAAGIYFLTPAKYQAESKLLIRYIVENKTENPAGPDQSIKSPDSRGENIINSELEILTSGDLATEVARLVGPEKILAKAGGGTNLAAAAIVVRSGITPDVPKRSDVIRLLYAHPDPEVAQLVLRQLVDSYLKKHLEIHRSVGLMDEMFSTQADQMRSRLATTDEELRKIKARVGVVNLEDSKKAYSEQLTKVRQDIYTAEAELAERKELLKEVEAITQGGGTNATTTVTNISLDVINQYKSLCAQIESLRKREMDLRTQYTDENPIVKSVREQIALADKQKAKMEADAPNLVKSSIASPDKNQQPFDPLVESSRIASLETKIKVLTGQLEKIRLDAAQLDEAESSIRTLQRRREFEETNFQYFTASLERARLAETMGPGKVSNISIVQAATPAGRDMKKLLKMIAMALAGGIGGGIGLAFLIEMVLDPSIKRPSDIENKLKLSVFLTLPDTSTNGYSHPNGANGKSSSKELTTTSTAPWDAEHPLHDYFESMRDRITMHFQNVHHKPKMLAVTSCGKGAGVSTLAAGLAAGLSEVGDGNVLLVDMNVPQGVAQAFYQGKPACDLAESMEDDKRQASQVNKNLFLATASELNEVTGELGRIMPKRFAGLVPKLKASDYDYIVFDMPALSQTSITSKLAPLMDLNMLVIESEKTQTDVVKQAAKMLSEVRAPVTTVLNKKRSYVPTQLHQEL